MAKVRYTRDDVLRDLRENVCEVYFTKVDGNKRKMRCSLKPEALPDSYALTEEAKEREFHETNKDIIRCWDLEANGWRSFRIDSIEYINAVEVL